MSVKQEPIERPVGQPGIPGSQVNFANVSA